MASDTPTRRNVLTGLAVLPAAAAPVTAQADQPALKPDGSPRHDPVMPDTDHTRTYHALARK